MFDGDGIRAALSLALSVNFHRGRGRLCFLAMILGVGLGSCNSTVPPGAQAEPYPARYRELAKDYLRRALVDPYSVRDAEIAEPIVKASFYLVDPAPGWTICVRYNAKNRMGAYAGMTEDALLVRGDKVTISLNELTTPTRTAGICSDAKWAPFKELGA